MRCGKQHRGAVRRAGPAGHPVAFFGGTQCANRVAWLAGFLTVRTRLLGLDVVGHFRRIMSENDARTVAASQAEMLQLVLPSDANTLGNALGGVVMHHMDIVAAIAAQRHAGHACVTASVDRIDFLHPVKVGELLVLRSSVNFAGRTSMEVGVRCQAENPRTRERRHTASAYFTFVALGDDGRPTCVPTLVPETDEQRRRCAEAQRRRSARLALRGDGLIDSDAGRSAPKTTHKIGEAS